MRFFSLTIVIMLTLSCTKPTKPVKTGKEGAGIPAFSLLLLDSTTYINTKDIPSDKPIVLFYFSPECPFCRAQTADMIKNIENIKDLRVYMFTTWPFEEARGFYAHYNLSKYSNVSVGIDYNNFFQNWFQSQGVPFTAVYDQHRNLKHAYLGYLKWREIKSIALN